MMSYKDWLTKSNSGAEWREAFTLSDKMSGSAKAACVMALYGASKREYNKYVREFDTSQPEG